MLQILLLTEDLKQVLVGEKVEAGEELPLRLQVLVGRLLDFLQLGARGVQVVEDALGLTRALGVSVVRFVTVFSKKLSAPLKKRAPIGPGQNCFLNGSTGSHFLMRYL